MLTKHCTGRLKLTYKKAINILKFNVVLIVLCKYVKPWIFF